MRRLHYKEEGMLRKIILVREYLKKKENNAKIII